MFDMCFVYCIVKFMHGLMFAQLSMEKVIFRTDREHLLTSKQSITYQLLYSLL